MRKLALAAAVAAAFASPSSAPAAFHAAKIPFDVHTRSNVSCIYFQLEGVATADPAVGPAPWFALSKDHPHFAELFAILLTAGAGRRLTNVVTEGAACNAPSVDTISLN